MVTGVFEAGGSKTEFLLGTRDNFSARKASGIHPMFMQADAISAVLDELIHEIPKNEISQIFFYGASCGSHELSNKVRSVLEQKFPDASITVESDLLGTARALCGREAGFASIMGTGSNACIFDGNTITDRMLSFGFWLGDEGSGAFLGKKVFRAWLKNHLPDGFSAEAEEIFGSHPADALRSLLEGPNPNARMARLGGLAIKNRRHPFFKILIQESIGDFFRENADLIGRAGSLPFHFSGSVAYYLKEEITQQLVMLGLNPGIFADCTAERLFLYHV